MIMKRFYFSKSLYTFQLFTTFQGQTITIIFRQSEAFQIGNWKAKNTCITTRCVNTPSDAIMYSAAVCIIMLVELNPHSIRTFR